MLAKNLAYFAKADSAGIVLGARVPVVSDVAREFATGANGFLRGGGALCRCAAPPRSSSRSVNHFCGPSKRLRSWTESLRG